MLKNIFVIAFFFLFAILSEVDLQLFYNSMVEYLQANDMQLVGGGVLLSLGLLALSVVFNAIRWYSVLLAMSKLAFALSKLFACLVSLLVVACFVQSGINLWLEIGFLPACLPFLFLGASSMSIRIFDFNYPIRNELVAYFLLLALSGVVVMAAQMAGY